MANAETNSRQDKLTFETALSILNSLQEVSENQLQGNIQVVARTRGSLRTNGKAQRIINAETNLKQIGIIDLNLTTTALKALAVQKLAEGDFRGAVNIATLSYGVKNTDAFANTLLSQKRQVESARATNGNTPVRAQSNMVTVLSWRSFEVKGADGKPTGEIGYGANEIAFKEAETVSKGTAITPEMIQALIAQQNNGAVIDTEDGTIEESTEEVVEATDNF